MKPFIKQILLFDSLNLDPGARAFLIAAQITNKLIINSINTFVIGLKNNNLWSKFFALYPLVGGNSNAHKFNLINPADTNAARRLTFNGGITHNSNGITYNGVNGYADTNLLSNTPTQNNVSFGVYSKTAGGSSGAEFSQGSSVVNPKINLFIQAVSGNTVFDLNNTYAGTVVALATTATGLYISSRTGLNNIDLYRRGANVSSQADASSFTSSANIQLGLVASGGYTSRNICYYHISTGLTSGEVTILNNLVQTLQTTLGRNAY